MCNDGGGGVGARGASVLRVSPCGGGGRAGAVRRLPGVDRGSPQERARCRGAAALARAARRERALQW